MFIGKFVLRKWNRRRGEFILKSDNNLKILLRLKNAYNVAEKNGFAYQQFTKENSICLDVRKQLELFRMWYCSLSDLVNSLYQAKQAFDNSLNNLENVIKFFDTDVVIPDYIDKSKLTQGVSLKTVLRIGRNWKEHPDKINQEDYKLLADHLDNQVLVRGLYLIQKLLVSEFESLDREERRIMLATSSELKSEIRAIQNLWNQIKPFLETKDEFTPELRKSLDEFMEFTPNKDNVILVDDKLK